MQVWVRVWLKDYTFTARHGAVQYGIVQYKTTQHSTEQCSTVQYSTVQYSTVKYSAVQYSTVLYSTALYSTLQHTTSLPAHRLTLRAIYDTEGLRIARIPVGDLVVRPAGYVLTFICCIGVHVCVYVWLCVHICVCVYVCVCVCVWLYCDGLRPHEERYSCFLFRVALQIMLKIRGRNIEGEG